MKHYLLLTLISMIPLFSDAQNSDSTGKFGFVINSGLNGEINPIRLGPGVTYNKGNNQLELGFGLNPFTRKDQRILSCDLNYKYFPNGTTNKFNMYLITRFSYIYNARDTYFPTTYNYLFLNGGYGFEINAFKGVYLGTNISIGSFTYSKDSENPYPGFAKNKLFDELGFNLATQFNVGYRF
ncbi:hypothetical protein ACE01N_11110 [Saccharicrinis sp. FJH2]|uniref:hypothetical protein n=1 Tax=Saccharicrinis sp. FJH65 TaxID=3344659 RepID=UPI0035F346EA